VGAFGTDIIKNRLYCFSCKRFLEIFEFPWKISGFIRYKKCLYCHLKAIRGRESDALEFKFPYFQESHYCSRCGKLRTPEQFDTFKTCEICRKTSESHRNLEKSTIDILNEWVQKAGEQEIASRKLQGG